MEPSGQAKGETSNPNAPVFFTMALPKGKKTLPENKEGPKMKGKEEGTTLKGKVQQWAEVGGTGKATAGENRHPLHHTMEAYGEEKDRKPLFEKKGGKRRQNRSVEKGRVGIGGYTAEILDWPKEKEGRKINWGPTSILPGTAFQLVERQDRKGKGGRNPYILGGVSAADYKKILKISERTQGRWGKWKRKMPGN